MSEQASLGWFRYCTGCCSRKRHSRRWLGTYCLRCRITSIPRRCQACARFYDWRRA